MRLAPDTAWALWTIAGEGRGEHYNGKVGIAETIRNRVARRYNCNGTVIGCVLAPKQFSCWNSDDPNRRLVVCFDELDPVMVECQKAWAEACRGSNLTQGAVLYANLSVVAPKWSYWARKTVQIDNHTFFCDP